MSTALSASRSTSRSSYNYASAEISRSPVSSKARVCHFNSVRRTELTTLGAAFTECRKLPFPTFSLPLPGAQLRSAQRKTIVAERSYFFYLFIYLASNSAHAETGDGTV